MGFRDFLLLSAICFIWGLNLVVTRWVLSETPMPPIFFAALRFAGLALVLAWFLRPAPANLLMVFMIAMGFGALHFGFLFTGLMHAEAGAAAIIGQLSVPFSTLLSMVILKEVIGWRRGLGIMLAFAGAVLIVAADSQGFAFSHGLLYIVAAAAMASVAAILMKKMPPISALQMQAWTGLFSCAPLFVFSAMTERHVQPWQVLIQGGWPIWGAAIFAILGVSVFGHGGFYSLVKKYDISLISPLTLMTPIWSIVLSVAFMNEIMTAQQIAGAVISLGGVFIILIRTNRKMPEAALADKLSGNKQ